MSKTHRAHLAQDDYRARSHRKRTLRTLEERKGKSAKAARAAERRALRKEYLR